MIRAIRSHIQIYSSRHIHTSNTNGKFTDFIKNNDLPTIYKADSVCPSVHLSFEKYLMMQCKKKSCFLRTNPKTVVIGSNQLAFAECNSIKMKEDNVKLIRRSTGGGAVMLDEGNCMFGIFGDKSDVNRDIFIDIMIKSINTTFNVNAIPTGKNDVSVNGSKVAGLSYGLSKERYLCHACILVNANTSLLPLYLTPNQKKLDSNAVKSVDKRVCNLVLFDKSKTIGHLEDNIITEFKKYYGAANIIYVTESDILRIDEVRLMTAQMNDSTYLYGKHITYNVRISKKFIWGFIELFVNVNKSQIEHIYVNTDCLDINIALHIKQLYQNVPLNELHKLHHDNKEIQDVIQFVNEELNNQ